VVSRRPVTTVALMCLALAVSACGVGGEEDNADNPSSGASAPTGDPIVIGMLEDSSGTAAGYSQLAAAAIEVAIAEINQNGGIDDRPIELIRQNDQNQPTQAPALVRRLADDGAVAILMNSGSASGVQVKPVCAELEITCLTVTSLNTSIGLPPDNEFSFMMANPVTDIGTVFLEAFEEIGVESVGNISDDSPTIAGLDELLIPQWEEAGIEMTAEEKVPVDAADVSAQIARLKSSDPDAIYIGSLGGQQEVLIQNALAQQMPDVPRFSLASIGNQPATWRLANPGALEGLLYASSVSTENPRTLALVELLEEELGDDFLGLTAYEQQGYDSVYLLKAAIESAGGVEDKAKIKDGLEQVSGYQPTFGGPDFTLSFSPDKHLGPDGLCGLVIGEFTSENEPGDPWPEYQPSC
jgi:branched-chain amino acid transport system substrate-binding protein